MVRSPIVFRKIIIILIIILLLVLRSWAIFQVLPVLGHLCRSEHKSEMSTATQKTNISLWCWPRLWGRGQMRIGAGPNYSLSYGLGSCFVVCISLRRTKKADTMIWPRPTGSEIIGLFWNLHRMECDVLVLHRTSDLRHIGCTWAQGIDDEELRATFWYLVI